MLFSKIIAMGLMALGASAMAIVSPSPTCKLCNPTPEVNPIPSPSPTPICELCPPTALTPSASTTSVAKPAIKARVPGTSSPDVEPISELWNPNCSPDVTIQQCQSQGWKYHCTGGSASAIEYTVPNTPEIDFNCFPQAEGGECFCVRVFV